MTSYVTVSGVLVIIALRVFDKKREANFALFILVSVLAPQILCSVLGWAHPLVWPGRDLAVPVMSNVAGLSGSTLAAAMVIPRLRWLGVGFIGGLAGDLCTSDKVDLVDVVIGLAVACLTTILLHGAFRRYRLLPAPCNRPRG